MRAATSILHHMQFTVSFAPLGEFHVTADLTGGGAEVDLPIMMLAHVPRVSNPCTRVLRKLFRGGGGSTTFGVGDAAGLRAHVHFKTWL